MQVKERFMSKIDPAATRTGRAGYIESMRVTVTSDQIRAAFDAVKHDHSFDESRGLWEQGRLPAQMIQAMCLRPEILRAFGGFGDCVYPGGLLSRREKELVIIESSRANACQFCTNSHLDLVKMIGLIPDPMNSLDDLSTLSQRERLAIEYTRAAMMDSNRVPDAFFDQLRRYFTDAEMVELTFLIGFINMLNLFNNCLRVRYEGEYAALK
jgi:AhpD family alkylhydroperoxidase